MDFCERMGDFQIVEDGGAGRLKIMGKTQEKSKAIEGFESEDQKLVLDLGRRPVYILVEGCDVGGFLTAKFSGKMTKVSQWSPRRRTGHELEVFLIRLRGRRWLPIKKEVVARWLEN